MVSRWLAASILCFMFPLRAFRHRLPFRSPTSSSTLLIVVLLGASTLRLSAEIPALWDHYIGETSIPAYRDGPASEARFSYPRGIDVDASGNIYIADGGNAVVRRISTAGEVTTFAGKIEEYGYIDGPRSTARFSLLYGLTIGSDGHIYVADGNRIRKISPSGSVTTIAGGGNVTNLSNGATTAATNLTLWYNNDVAVDADLNVYTTGLAGVIKISPSGLASVVSGVDSFGYTTDLEIDAADNLHVVSSVSSTIDKRTPGGTVTELDFGTSGTATSNYINTIAFQPGGELWLASENRGQISRQTADGQDLIEVLRYRTDLPESGILQAPRHIAAAPMGGVYVTDVRTHSILHVAANGTVTVVAGPGGKTQTDGSRETAGFGYPQNTVAPGNGYLYVIDGPRLRRTSLSTGAVDTITYIPEDLFPHQSSQSWRDFTADAAGNFYFVDYPLHCISRLSAEGEWSIIAGVTEDSRILDGTGLAARFANPRSITIDAAGNLYVADHDEGNVVRRISPDGEVATIAGANTVSYGSADGIGSAARFNRIAKVAAQADGSVWVGDAKAIRYISTEGEVRTIAGGEQAGYPGAPDGVGSAAVVGNIQAMVAPDDRSVMWVEFNDARVRWTNMDGRVESASLANRNDLHGGDVDLDYLAQDRSGKLYAVDRDNKRIYVAMLQEDGGRLANLSVLKRVGDDGEALTVGFVIEGDTPKPTLIRAVGPTLANHGVTSGYMPDPMIGLFDREGTQVELSDNWSEAGNLATTMQELGAFSLEAGSTDAALVRAVPGGPFTATVQAADDQPGQVLVEVYDADLAGATRFTNVSTLTQVGPGGGRLIAGFVITGSDAKTMLIRGVGPSLTGVGVPGGAVLPNPRIKLFRQSELIATNDDWNGAPLLADAATAVGAFPLADEDSADAVLLIRLTPGVYSVHLESATAASGLAIAEVYEVK